MNKVLIITSIVTAAAVLIYTVFAGLQWWAIRKQAEHTASQAITMQGQLDAMKTQARLLQHSLTETRNLVAQNERAVQAAEQSIEAARENLIDEQRAHVRVTGGDAPGNAFRLRIENTGKTPAADVQVRAIAQVGYTPPPVPTPDESPNGYTYIGVLPNGGFREHQVRTASRITDEQQRLLADPTEEFRLWCSGVIYYEDVFGKSHKTAICLFREGGNMQFEFWVMGNEAT